MSEIRKRAIEGLKVGDTFTIIRTFTERDTIHFADITKDYNPVHFDERFARVKNFRGRICHGLLVASMLSEIGGQIGWLASDMSFRFQKPVYFGDKIQCHFTITEINEKGRAQAKAVYQNQDGMVVLDGHLSGIIPCSPEQKVMKKMVAEGDPTNKLSK